jgi:hypothetical protein
LQPTRRGCPWKFFLTGNALAKPGMRDWTRRAIDAGHYLGPHSHGHLLYAAWGHRQRSLLSKRRFQADLYRNLAELRDLGSSLERPVYFVPPFEWYNADHAAWAKQVGCQIVSFTPGSGSHRDFAPEDHKAFRASSKLIEDILDFEAETQAGLNGHLLLLHLGSARKDKMHPHLGELIDQLRQRVRPSALHYRGLVAAAAITFETLAIRSGVNSHRTIGTFLGAVMPILTFRPRTATISISTWSPIDTLSPILRVSTNTAILLRTCFAHGVVPSPFAHPVGYVFLEDSRPNIPQNLCRAPSRQGRDVAGGRFFHKSPDRVVAELAPPAVRLCPGWQVTDQC